MSATVGYAVLQVIPSARGFGPALASQTAAPVAAAGKTSGKGFGTGMLGSLKGFAGTFGLVLGAAAVAGFVKNSVALEKEFSQTMNTLGAVAEVPKRQLRELEALAVEFGQATVFSTNEAADAMLELAKGGLSVAQIKAGALDATLQLAAASGETLGASATVIANSLNTFGLEAEDASAVAAALAGGANASTASMGSLAQALSQVGPGAVDAGLSIQETTAALAAFDNAGVKGSDAGTSLKTFLARLVPATDRAATAFSRLGLEVLDNKGNFKSLGAISQELKEGIKGLSDAERTAYLNAAFGSDARRAAIILAEQGAKGLEKLIAKTSDQGAAERVAAARMKGTAGALEQLSGSWETLQLAVGKVLAPLTKFGALGLTSLVNAITPGVNALADAFGGKGGGFGSALDGVGEKFRELVDVVRPALQRILDVWQGSLLPAIKRFIPVIAPVVAFLGGVLFDAIKGFIGGILQVVSGVLKALGGLIDFLTGVFTGNWSLAWQGIKDFLGGILEGILGAVKAWLNFGIIGIFRKGLAFLLKGVWVKAWNGIKSFVPKVLNGIKFAISAYFRLYWTIVKGALSGISSAFTTVWNAIKGFVVRIFSSVVSIFRGAFTRLADATRSGVDRILSFFRDLPSKIKGLFSSAGSWLLETGKDIVRGLLDGAGSLLPSIGNFFLSKLPGWIQGPFKKALGIESPSKVFAGYGENLSEGLVVGVERSKGKAQSAVDGMVGVPRIPKVGSGGVLGAVASGGPSVRQPVVLTLDGRKVAETVFEIGGREYAYGRRV